MRTPSAAQVGSVVTVPGIPDMVVQRGDFLGLGCAALRAGKGLDTVGVLVWLGRDFAVVPGVVDHRQLAGLGLAASFAFALCSPSSLQVASLVVVQSPQV